MQLNMQQLLQLIQNTQSDANLPPKSIKLAEPFLHPNEIEALPKDIRQIYDYVFSGNGSVIEIEKMVPFRKRTTKMPVCNKVLGQRQQVFRCFDCFIHEAAVFCISCFEAGNHDGHRFKKIVSSGGNCDCGNPMAVRPDGFCRNHSGKAEIMEIDEKQKQTFLYYFKYLFDWLFKFIQKNKKESDKLGKIILTFLTNLNKESIYYNSLTFHLFQQKIQNSEKTILHQIFYLFKTKYLTKTASSLFFQMFSLEEFKYILTIQFVSAYNEIEGFQDTGFHSLYIQLFANNDITTKICREVKHVLHPKKKYNLSKILHDIRFISSLQKQVAIEYFDCYFDNCSTIPLPYLDKIEEICQEGEDHIVSLISTFLNEENQYYYLIIDILAVIKGEVNLLTKIIQGTCEEIKKHSYNKNRVILPYHRFFGQLLFTIFEGNIQKITLKNVSKILNKTKEETFQLLEEYCQKIMLCLLEFAQTFGKNSYFQSYALLYIRKGVISINFDFQLLRIIACIFANQGKNFNLIFIQLFEENLKEEEKKQNKLTSQELVKKWISFLGLMDQCILSHKNELILYQKLDLKNEQLNSEFCEFFISVCKFASPISTDHIQSLNKYFLGKFPDQLMEKYLVFEKTTKKYSLHPEIEGSKLCFKYYQSLLKVSQEFPNASQKDQRYEPILTKKNVHISNAFALKQLFLRVFNLLTSFHDEEQYNPESFQLFQEEILKIKQIYEGEQIYDQIYMEVLSYIKHENKRKSSVEEDTKKLQTLKIKKSEKLKKMKEKQNKFLTSYEKEQKPIAIPEDFNLCMICRQSTENQPLCYLTYLYKSNTFNFFVDQSKKSFFFRSCLHSAHYKCCFKIYGKKQVFSCPLCKTYGNVLLPCSDKNFTLPIFKEVLVRISTISAMHDNSNVGSLSDDEKIFFKLLQAFPQMVGLVSLKQPSIYKQNGRQVVHSLYILVKNIWQHFPENSKKQFQEFMKTYLKSFQVVENKSSVQNVIQSMKHFIISFIFSSLTNTLPQISQIFQNYGEKINYFDLKELISRLFQCVNLSIMPQTQSPMINDEIIKLQQCFSYFDPPENVKELIELREKPENKCKNGHNVGICVVCQKGFCLQCKLLKAHTKQVHAGNALYFSLLTGGLIYDELRTKIIGSLYENKIGQEWNEEKNIDGFIFDAEAYQQMIKKLPMHSLNKYLENKEPEFWGNLDIIQN